MRASSGRNVVLFGAMALACAALQTVARAQSIAPSNRPDAARPEPSSPSPPPADPEDPCASPQVAVDQERHCCEPGQHFVGGHCQGAPAVCSPGAVREHNTCAPAACTDGRVRPEANAPCCWPGQHLSHGACTGAVEACPTGTTRLSSDDCTPAIGPVMPRPRTRVPARAVWVPGGTFRMGPGDRVVTLQPFAIDRTEVTVGAYEACVRQGRCEAARDAFAPTNTSTFPRRNVTFAMARQYCGFAGGRLPTEAEWELTARGYDRRPYPWGMRVPDCRLARFAGCGEGPVAAGSLRAGASPFGAREMAGNVAEWVSDRGGALPSASAWNPTGPARGDTRIVRGGAFDANAGAIRATARREIDPHEARYDVGFRCVY